MENDSFKKKRGRLIQARHRRKTKSILIEYKGGKCQVCGYDKCQTSLHFHHTNFLLKEFGISQKGMGEIEKLKKEVDKCILICSNCHGEIHEKEYLENISNLEKETNVYSRTYGLRTCIVCKKTFKSEELVSKKCHQCKNKKINKPDLCLEELEQNSIREIIKKYKCSQRYILEIRKKFGIKQNRIEKIQWPTQDELSILVYSKPLILLSKDLGVSDRAIKKRCIKLGIKTPPAGYWLHNKPL